MQTNGTWRSAPERGHLLILRGMVWLSLRLGRRLSKPIVYGIASYFLLFSPSACRASQQYLRQALHRPVTLADRFQHIFTFATTIHDRLYLLNDRFDLFDFKIYGEDLILQALQQKKGLILMGAHIGSFEVLRAIGRRHEHLKISILMYPDNALKMNAALQAINPAALDEIIPLGHIDSMLKAENRLQQGHIICMLADRSLSGDTSQYQSFLGKVAPFPQGPFRVAAILKCPVVFMTGLYMGGNQYDVHFEALADFSAVERQHRTQKIALVQREYADKLTYFCQHAPYNWFNFFDFWASNQ